LARGQRIAAASADKVQSLEQECAEAEAEQAAHVAALIAAGAPMSELPAAIDPDLSARLAAARTDFNIKTKALQSLTASHAQAQAELQIAEHDVVQAVDELLNNEREQLAGDVERTYLRLSALVGRLRTATPDPLHTPVNIAINISPTVAQALARIPAVDALHIPVNQLRDGVPSDRASWIGRRARLIAGDPIAEEDAAA
jgi:hypothetical protein